MNPYFSVIIPAKNEEVNLPILLQSLTLQTDKDFEVIVSDDASIDNTKEIAVLFKDKFINFQLITHKSSNVAKGRNLGAKKALGEYLIFLDADVEVSPVFIADIKKHIIKNNPKVLSLLYQPKNANWKGRLCLSMYNIGVTLSKDINPLSGGACLAITNKLFKQLSGYDETVVFGEDSDIVKRAFKSKAKFYVFPTPIIYVSTRRYEKEGLISSINKIIKSNYYMTFIGPIRKPLFRYEMGGQYYQKK